MSRVSSGAVFCAIPVGETDLYRRAMANLNEQAKLRPNQMIVNIREDHTLLAYLGLFCTHELTLSADVIQFGESMAEPPPAPAPVPPAPAPAPPAPAPAPPAPAPAQQ